MAILYILSFVGALFSLIHKSNFVLEIVLSHKNQPPPAPQNVQRVCSAFIVATVPENEIVRLYTFVTSDVFEYTTAIESVAS